LNKGFNNAVIKSIGNINISPTRTALFLFKYIEYEQAQISDMLKLTGCIKNIENPIAATKYNIFTKG